MPTTVAARMQRVLSGLRHSNRRLSPLLLAGALLFLVTAPKSEAAISGKNVIDGNPVSVEAGKKGTVMVFLSAVCPCSNSHLPVLRHLAAKFPDFSFVAVHSNKDESAEATKEYFRTAGLSFPAIQDENLKIANEYGAYKTPHAFLVSRENKVLYRGGVTSSSSASADGKQFLEEALSAVQEGKRIAIPEGRTLGCVIAR